MSTLMKTGPAPQFKLLLVHVNARRHIFGDRKLRRVQGDPFLRHQNVVQGGVHAEFLRPQELNEFPGCAFPKLQRFGLAIFESKPSSGTYKLEMRQRMLSEIYTRC